MNHLLAARPANRRRLNGTAPLIPEYFQSGFCIVNRCCPLMIVKAWRHQQVVGGCVQSDDNEIVPPTEVLGHRPMQATILRSSAFGFSEVNSCFLPIVLAYLSQMKRGVFSGSPFPFSSFQPNSQAVAGAILPTGPCLRVPSCSRLRLWRSP